MFDDVKLCFHWCIISNVTKCSGRNFRKQMIYCNQKLNSAENELHLHARGLTLSRTMTSLVIIITANPSRQVFLWLSNSVWTNLLRSRVNFQYHQYQFCTWGFEDHRIPGLQASLKTNWFCGILQFFVVAGQIAFCPKRGVCLSILKMASKETLQITYRPVVFCFTTKSMGCCN